MVNEEVVVLYPRSRSEASSPNSSQRMQQALCGLQVLPLDCPPHRILTVCSKLRNLGRFSDNPQESRVPQPHLSCRPVRCSPMGWGMLSGAEVWMLAMQSPVVTITLCFSFFIYK